MLSVGIVGSQGKSFSLRQRDVAKQLILMIAATYKDHIVRLVSGGEPTGVDAWAEEITDAYSWGDKVIHRPAGYDWEHFRARNLLIAQDSDILYAIRSRNSKTYGSGWTADRAEDFGKDVYRYYV